MHDKQEMLADWVANEVLPYEAFVRGWLIRRWGQAVDADDVLQEAYCRISSLRSIAHIESGRAYFFTTVQSVVLDGMRKAKVANIRSMTEIDWEYVMDEAPSPDRVVEGRQQLERVRAALDGLSEMARQVIKLRRLSGLSQRETAERLGVSEHIVENHVTRGLREVLKAMAEEENQWTDDAGGKRDRR